MFKKLIKPNKYVFKYSKEPNYGELIKKQFVDEAQVPRIISGQCPARRAVFLKPHGVAYGKFTVVDDLPSKLKVGIFKNKEYETWVRFSSDTKPYEKDVKTTLGIGIKLFGVKGEKLIDNGSTQDFILQNIDVFFVDTAKDMYEFTASPDEYMSTHPVTKEILNEMEKIEKSCFTDYWSCLPYSFGEKYVKYKLSPFVEHKSSFKPENENYLALDFQKTLLEHEIKFKFMVQFQTNDKDMPLDKATVRWSEDVSKPIHVATLTLLKQDVNKMGQKEYGENLAYNPWHCLKEHKPQGSISDARKIVYKADATTRHVANGISDEEPNEPRKFQ